MQNITKTSKRGIFFKFFYSFLIFTFVMGSLASFTEVSANSSITPASGGNDVSLDTVSGVFTDLSDITINESVTAEIGTGVHTFSLPAGWEFDTSSNITYISDWETSGLLVADALIFAPTSDSFSINVTVLSWAAPSQMIFTGLKVRPTGPTTGAGDITHTTGTIAGVVNGTTSFGALSTVPGTVNMPTSFFASLVGTNQANLTWSVDGTVDGFEIFRNDTLLTTTSDITYSDSDLAADSTFTYKVRAYVGAVKSEFSDTVSISTPASSGGGAVSPPSGDGSPAFGYGGGGGGGAVVVSLNAPTNLKVTDYTNNAVTITWDTVSRAKEYEVYRNDIDSAWDRAELIGTVENPTFADADLNHSTTYFYSVKAVRNSVISIFSTPALATTLTAEGEVLGEKVDEREVQVDRIVTEAIIVASQDLDWLLEHISKERNLALEKISADKYTTVLVNGAENLSETDINTITNFITYSTISTIPLGAGERAGVIHSYKTTFGRLPVTVDDWEDVLKVANGRWPDERSFSSEAEGEIIFKKIYLRDADRGNENDNAAVNIIAYGLRPDVRNLESESNAMNNFKKIFGHTPSSTTDWDAVRAIAYSGAIR